LTAAGKKHFLEARPKLVKVEEGLAAEARKLADYW
jgi:hypothetical protein